MKGKQRLLISNQKFFIILNYCYNINTTSIKHVYVILEAILSRFPLRNKHKNKYWLKRRKWFDSFIQAISFSRRKRCIKLIRFICGRFLCTNIINVHCLFFIAYRLEQRYRMWFVSLKNIRWIRFNNWMDRDILWIP